MHNRRSFFQPAAEINEKERRFSGGRDIRRASLPCRLRNFGTRRSSRFHNAVYGDFSSLCGGSCRVGFQKSNLHSENCDRERDLHLDIAGNADSSSADRRRFGLFRAFRRGKIESPNSAEGSLRQKRAHIFLDGDNSPPASALDIGEFLDGLSSGDDDSLCSV
jgi:hypothetical protein